MKNTLLVCLLSVSSGTTVLADVSGNQCTETSCAAGTKALTYFKKSEPYYSCPNREIGTYVTTVTTLVAMQAALGVMPNISDQTGEPEYQGQTKSLVDSLRTKAKVRTFDEALNACAIGRSKRKVTVMNMPVGSMVAYVFDDELKVAYWMPVSHLDKTK